MTQTREVIEIDAVEGELPYTPKGWRNLWFVSKTFRGVPNGTIYKAGSSHYGLVLFATKDQAVNAAHQQLEKYDSREWLGAFEVEG